MSHWSDLGRFGLGFDDLSLAEDLSDCSSEAAEADLEAAGVAAADLEAVVEAAFAVADWAGAREILRGGHDCSLL